MRFSRTFISLAASLFLILPASGAFALGNAVKLGGGTTAAPAPAPEPMPTPAQCGRFPDNASSYRCLCPADARAGSVWGSGPYTADSGICAAAVHAGVLQAGQPGEVSVLRIRGLDAYSGSTANGVTTRRWGAYSSSITFNRN